MENNDDDRDSARMVVAEELLTAATSIELEHPKDSKSGGLFYQLSSIKRMVAVNGICNVKVLRKFRRHYFVKKLVRTNLYGELWTTVHDSSNITISHIKMNTVVPSNFYSYKKFLAIFT